MSTTDARTGDAGATASVKNVDMRLEVVVIPVSDVDRAREFYGRLGWRLDADRTVGDDFRLVQFTPPGSACSVQFGTSRSRYCPSPDLAVSAVKTAHDELVKRGVEVSDVYHCAEGTACRFRETHTSSLRGRPARQLTYRMHLCVRRSPTVNTRSASAEPTRTGRRDTPSTWWPSRPARGCRHKRLRPTPISLASSSFSTSYLNRSTTCCSRAPGPHTRPCRVTTRHDPTPAPFGVRPCRRVVTIYRVSTKI